MKTKEELNAIKEEVETLNKKLAELSDEELKIVTGGIKFNHSNEFDFNIPKHDNDKKYAPTQYFDTDPEKARQGFIDAIEEFKKNFQES